MRITMNNRRLPRGVLLALAILVWIFLASDKLVVLNPYLYDGYIKPELGYQVSGRQTQKQAFTPKCNNTPVIQYVEVPGPPQKDPSCAWIPDTSNILLVMKTGASESFSKVPTQLMTTLRCVSDFLIFSDMKQTIVGVDIHDSLETVLMEVMEENSDFDLYRRQNACAADQERCIVEPNESMSSAGWNLDKYKNIHVAERTYDMRPGYDWYVTVDADTYVLWPTLIQWLSTLDPSEKRYFGSATTLNGFLFGHGGSGYILSRAAMKDFVGNNPGVASRYDAQTKDVCCGDYMIGKALKDTIGVSLENAWPSINGEKPFTLPFNADGWCHPAVTMHHMTSEEISIFWEFERRFYAIQEPSVSRILLLKDIYKEFLEPRLRAKREDWDNLSEDRYYLDPTVKDYAAWQLDRVWAHDMSGTEKEAHKSFDHCAKMCDEVNECFQFRFQDGICAYQRGFLLGKPRQKEEDQNQRWLSGWPVSKIKAWVKNHETCEEPLWPTFN